MRIFQKALNFVFYDRAYVFGLFSAFFAFCFFAIGLIATNSTTIGPSDSHVVSLFVDGEETAAPTRAKTVGEFIDKVGIKTSPYDLIEPVKETPIDANNFRVSIYRAYPVTIIEGEKKQTVVTPHRDAKMIASNAGIVVHPEDKLVFSMADNFIEEGVLGQKLTIDRATPVVMTLYGTEPIVFRTHAQTVGDFLEERGITLDQNATLAPNTNTPITERMLISISQFGKQVISVEEDIPFAYETTPDSTKTIGQITVINQGRVGKKQMVYELQLQDGKEIGRRILQEVVVEEPVTQRQTRGTLIPPVESGDKVAWMRAAGIAESDFYYVDFIIKHESTWRPGAINAIGCYGLGQACPGSKLVAVCPNWQNDPVCQLQFFSRYAINRYGSWAGAYNGWVRQGWW